MYEAPHICGVPDFRRNLIVLFMLFVVSVIINFLFILGVLFIIFVLLLPVVLGAPYLPSSQEAVERMVAVAQVMRGERMVDLGSGDGRIVLAFAQSGSEAHGYEINPLLVFISRRRIRRAGLQNRAFIHWRNFRRVDFSSFKIVTIYGLKGIMRELEGKLQRQLPPGGRVLSYTFQFPHWRASSSEQGVYLYKKF